MHIELLRAAERIAGFTGKSFSIFEYKGRGWAVDGPNSDHVSIIAGALDTIYKLQMYTSPHPTLDVFVHHFRRILDLDIYAYYDGTGPARQAARRVADAVNDYVNDVRSKTHKDRIDAMYLFSQRNRESMTSYVDQLFRTYNSLTVVNVNLLYMVDVSPTVTMEDIRADREAYLRRLKASNKDIVGLIWKMERSDQRGLFYRMVMFVKSDQTDDTILSNVYGGIWMAIKGKLKRFENQSKLNMMTGMGEFRGTGWVNNGDRVRMNYMRHTVIDQLMKFDDEIVAMMDTRCDTIGRMMLRSRH